MDYKYCLPNETNQPVEYITQNNSMIIIGANGSGKSKLGEWIEKQDEKTTHRIGAQRSLVFGHYIQQKSYEQATNLLIYGQENEQTDHRNRWGYDGEKYNYTSTLLNDYENVLSALIALKIRQQEEYISDCKMREAAGQSHNNVPLMVTDILQRIWKSVFPQRDIKLDDAKVTAVYSDNEGTKEYKGRDMSDGERVALYLIAQALCVPKNKTIIIDEPEVHLHRSIMNRLWTAIENERQDCLFIYITHDTLFAANHIQAKKIWVKSYDGEHWNLSEIINSTLPEELLLNILGNRRPVLFVEGTADSYDTKLYTEIYKKYYVVPCGSCSNVIIQTKAMRSNPQLHHLDCYGLIDRDFRSDYEIEKYITDNIFTINVAEVENLFLVEELLRLMATHIGKNPDQVFAEIKDYVINQRYAKQLNSQVCKSVVAQIKYKLMSAEISMKNDSEAKTSLNAVFDAIDYEEIKTEQENIFGVALSSNDYAEVIKVFNEKNIAKTIGHFFGFQDATFCSTVIALLQGEKCDDIIATFERYLPTQIPR